LRARWREGERGREKGRCDKIAKKEEEEVEKEVEEEVEEKVEGGGGRKTSPSHSARVRADVRFHL
jgi:hypothetical protein